jgi:Dyp-type peroxidase family
MTALDLDDIQGLIIRGYRKDVANHLVLRIDEPSAFKPVIADLSEEDPQSGPFVTVAADWTAKPPLGEAATSCVNIGFTFEGLRALGLDAESLASFPGEFQAGARARADVVCDVGSSSPELWKESLRGGDAHVIVSLFADDADELAAVTNEIRQRIADGAAAEIDCFAAHRLNGQDVEHFGYVDGLSQPTVSDAPRAGIKDPFDAVPAGEFVLGQPTQRAKAWHPPPKPDELGINGSFAAFRVMEQDVKAFEAFLTAQSKRVGIDRELVAAKICGRWRNGEPLVMRPSGVPAATISRENLNMFDYEATAAFPQSDRDGLLCPRGAHVRRAFPRSQRVVDDFDGFRRRIVRRGMPYGPAYDPEAPSDDERGLVGMFICASLANQFEYVMRNWLNDGLFTGGRLGRSKDPLTGSTDPDESRFEAPGLPRIEATGFPRFVATRGCAYVFLPSMTGLRYMAGVPDDR